MTLEQAFDAVVRTLRKERGLTQQQLAAASGYSRYHIGQLEQGKGGSTTIRGVFRLTSVLAIKPSELFQRVEEQVTHVPERGQK